MRARVSCDRGEVTCRKLRSRDESDAIVIRRRGYSTRQDRRRGEVRCSLFSRNESLVSASTRMVELIDCVFVNKSSNS